MMRYCDTQKIVMEQTHLFNSKKYSQIFHIQNELNNL